MATRRWTRDGFHQRPVTPGLFHRPRIEINGVIAPPPTPIAPGLFDYRTYLARQGIYYQLKVDTTNDWHAIDANTNTPSPIAS